MQRLYELKPEARLALLLLEELALRGGSSRLKYLKTYRYIAFWLGPDYAEYMLKRLVEGNYIERVGDKVRLKVRVAPSITYSRLVKLVDETVKTLYLERTRR